MTTLGEQFENYEVCHATGIEMDIIQACYDFCLVNIPNPFQTTGVSAMIEYLEKESEIDSDDLAYFTHETLQDYMNEHSPIGCYFGSHKGDATLGYWRILEYDQIGYEYEHCPKLPYSEKGYQIYSVDDNIGNRLAGFDDFLSKHYPGEYLHTELHEIIHELTDTDSESAVKTVSFCERIIGAVVEVLLPIITHKDMTWRYDNGVYGIFPEQPSIPGYRGQEKNIIIKKTSLYNKLVYIKENKASSKLISCATINDINNLVKDIMGELHYVALGQINNSQQPDNETMIEYIANDHHILTWVIGRVYWDDFRNQIDRLIGSQDITRLFLDILEHGESKIDGIDEGVYSLRETCKECEHLELDYDDIVNLECGCVGSNDFNNVWIVSEVSFFKSLKDVGAMVYETDSLYLYLQTTFAGNWYDTHLRKAWLKSYARLGELL